MSASTRATAVPVTPIDPIVNCKANICFLMHMSGSISSNTWQAEKAITTDAITTLVGPKDEPVAMNDESAIAADGAAQVYKFADGNPQEVLKLGWFSNTRKSTEHVKTIMAAGQNQGGTDIAGAISFCMVSSVGLACTVQGSFHTSPLIPSVQSKLNSAKAEALKPRKAGGLEMELAPVIVIMTDADDQASGDENVIKVAQAAKQAGIAIIAVGAGDKVDKAMVAKISGKRRDNHLGWW